MGSFQYGGIVEQIAVTATAAGTTTLTNTSKQIQVFTGTSTQTVVLPVATTYTTPGAKFEIYNESSGALTLQFSDTTAFTNAAGISYTTLAAHQSLILKLQTNATADGTWAVFSGGTGNTSGGMIGSNWVSYTPTITGFGTTSNVNCRSRRVGDSLEVQCSFTSGTPTAVLAQISLGYNGVNANVTIDTTKITSPAVVGVAMRSGSSTSEYGYYPLVTGGNTYLNLSVQGSSESAYNAINGNDHFVSGNTVQFLAISIPIVGWTWNV
jgi:hypothetical protein